MMSRPVTPCRSVSSDESLIAADSSSFSAQFFSRAALRSGPGGSGAGDHHGQPWTVFLNPEERKVGGSTPPLTTSSEA